MLIWLTLVACGPSTPDIDDPSDTAFDDTGDTEPAPSDEALARALIDGDRTDVATVVHQVAWSGGWPVATTEGTFLFVSTSPADLAGDHSAWTRVPLTDGPTVYWAEVAIGAPQGSRYKLVYAGDRWSDDPLARSYSYDEHGAISFVRPPIDDFRLDWWPDLAGEGLRARAVRVYVPAGTGPWPTVYMHDGQNLFDPAAFHGGWKIQDAVAALGTDLLVVGIDNTPDRMDEYAHVVDDLGGGDVFGGDAAAYVSLLQDDLRPVMEATYGTPPKTAVVGSSMGGLVSLYTALHAPGAFDLAGSLSGTLGWGRFGASNPTIEELYTAAGRGSTVLFVDSGGSDGGDGCTDPDQDGFPEDDPNDSDNYCTNRHFVDAMAGLGYTWDTDLYHWHAPGATHDEAAWAARIGRVFDLFDDL